MNDPITPAPPRSRSIPITFIATAICFLLTFANVSCQGRKVVTLSGVQLAFGTEIRDTDMWGNVRVQKLKAEPLATLALGTAAAGALFGFLGMTRFTTLLGAAGMLLLFLLKSNLDNDAATQSGGMFEITAGFGYILAVLLFLTATIMSGLTQLSEKQRTGNLVRELAPDKIADAT